MDKYTVTYILKNDLGGISSLIKNLVTYIGVDALPQAIIFIQVAGSNFATFTGEFVKDVPTAYFNHSVQNNLYHSFKKLKLQTGPGKGVVISNDVYDLLMFSCYNIDKKVIQLVHDAYNIKLAVQYEEVVDAFVCHSYFYYEVLRQLLPHRRDDINFISYGIPIITGSRKNNEELQLVFIGRHDKAKGIYDLFEIDHLLQQHHCKVSWLILGRGPETAGVKAQWGQAANISFYEAGSSSEITELCLQKDILVLPTKFEGFPVAMVEAMSAGCVPIVSDLPGGIRELGAHQRAIICTMDDNAAFAAAIMELNNNRHLLQQMGTRCREYIEQHHNAELQTAKYQQLFKEKAMSPGAPRHHQVNNPIGSRLDQPFIPNWITRLARKPR
jgi:glycosyltransferase involved in cell wall biosynthesis